MFTKQNGQTKVLTTLSNCNYKKEHNNNEAANEPPALPLKKKWLLSNRHFSFSDLAASSNETKGDTQSSPIMRGAYLSPFSPTCCDFNSKVSKDDSFYGQQKLESRDLSFREPSLKRSQSSYLSNAPWQMSQMPTMPHMQLPLSYYYPYPFYYPPPNSFQPHNMMPLHPVNGKSIKNSGAPSPISLPFQNVPYERANQKSSASANPFDCQNQSMHQSLIGQGESNSDLSEPDYCSGTEEDEHVENFRDLNKSWSCKSCTFVNAANKSICEMCFKSYPGKLRRSKGQKKSSSNFDQSKNTSFDEQFSFITESLIKEQIEVEKEMKRRLENERKIEKENRRLEKNQEKRRRRMMSVNNDNQDIQMIVDSLKGNKNTEREQMDKKDIENTLEKLEKEIITNLTGLDEILSNELKHQFVQNEFTANSVAKNNENHQSQKKPSLSNSTNKTIFVTSFHVEQPNPKNTSLPDYEHHDCLSDQTNSMTGDLKKSGSNALSQNYKMKDDPVAQTNKQASLARVQSSNEQQAQLESGFEMLQKLKEAEDLEYTADDLEVALNFDPTNPVQWLKENWPHMIETVMTLSNNQLLQNQKARGHKNPSILSMPIVNDREARAALRLTKGNIWQSIDKCVRRKEEGKFFDKNDVKSFSLNVEDRGKGQADLAINTLMNNHLESKTADCVKVQTEEIKSSNHDTKLPVLHAEEPVTNNDKFNQVASRVTDADKKLTKDDTKKVLSEVDQAIQKSLEALELSKPAENINDGRLIDHESNVNEHIKVLEKVRSKDGKKISEKLNKKTVSKAEHSEGNLSDSVTSNKITPTEHLNPNFDYARSAYECELCANSFHISDMITMISCTHKSCIECLRQYFTHSIREKSEVIIVCPFCKEPKIDPEDEDRLCDYLSLLDQQVKFFVSKELHELFQQKIRDRALSRDPGFKWCPSCSSGFIAPTPCAKTISCPDCEVVICALCNKVWEEQHFGISCEKFKEWKKANDPRLAEDKLNLHLEEFGIDCPNCNFHYELSKGGCMHFYCLKCRYDFCGGCQRPFKMGAVSIHIHIYYYPFNAQLFFVKLLK